MSVFGEVICQECWHSKPRVHQLPCASEFIREHYGIILVQRPKKP